MHRAYTETDSAGAAPNAASAHLCRTDTLVLVVLVLFAVYCCLLSSSTSSLLLENNTDERDKGQTCLLLSTVQHE